MDFAILAVFYFAKRLENEKTNKKSVYFHLGGTLYNMLLLKIKVLKNKLAKLHPPKKVLLKSIYSKNWTYTNASPLKVF